MTPQSQAPTVEELIHALGVAQIDPPAGVENAPTSQEMLAQIMTRCRIGEGKARRLLRQAVEAGILEPVAVARQTPMRPGWRYTCTVFVRGPKHEEDANAHLPGDPFPG